MSYYLPIKLDFTEDQFQYIKTNPKLLRHMGNNYMSLMELTYLHHYIHTRQHYNIDEDGDRNELANKLVNSKFFKNKSDLLDYDYVDSPNDEFYALGIVDGKLFYTQYIRDDLGNIV